MSAYIASIGKRTPRDAAQDAAELCRLANSLNRLNEIACNFGLTERRERRKENLQTRIRAVLKQAGLVLNHFESGPRGYAVFPAKQELHQHLAGIVVQRPRAPSFSLPSFSAPLLQVTLVRVNHRQ